MDAYPYIHISISVYPMIVSCALQDVSPAPYRGLLTLRGAVERLRVLLPETFPALPRDFACGVVSSQGALHSPRPQPTCRPGPCPSCRTSSCARSGVRPPAPTHPHVPELEEVGFSRRQVRFSSRVGFSRLEPSVFLRFKVQGLPVSVCPSPPSRQAPRAVVREPAGGRGCQRCGAAAVLPRGNPRPG